ncbi:MAG: bifunctional chorismate mutase/prephenate dehydrogenase [Desulfobacterium sp.]|jgi:chorismate mutase/prephenate dehydrogenase|nr:bifunctional chorismate mutase/prephenate dehydrogenase [Desulfobacterium sp.]
MTKEFDNEIKIFRDNIDRIDRQILELIAQRMDQVEKVVALKKTHNIPVYHPAREEDLISKLRTQASGAGVDPEFIEEMYRVILRNSRIRQTGQMKQKGIRPGAKVLMVGGRGQMGQFFATMFCSSDYTVTILGENDWENVEELCKGTDLVLICVPIAVTLETIKRVSPFVPPTAILADITSIKQGPVNEMLQQFNGPVIGLHPLFGPSCSTLDKQIIAVVPGRNNNACQWLLDQLTLWGAIVVGSTAREHDEIMDIVQALRHFATFCFGQFLCERNIKLEKSLEFSSPIYRLEIGMVGRLFAQSGNLYSEIIFATPDRRRLLKEYVASVNEQIALVDKNDKTLFEQRFAEIALWFGPFSEQAMGESDFIIDKLIERF